MSGRDPDRFPKLRAFDLRPSPSHPGAYDLFDPSGIAAGALTVSQATLSILAGMNGRNDKPDIQVQFMRRYGRLLLTEELDQLIQQLDEGRFLEGPRFEAYWAELLAEYRRAPSRPVRDVHSLGAPVDRLGAYFDNLINNDSQVRSGESEDQEVNHGQLVGIVAPHLDYKRGAPCYAAAYRGLAERTEAVRFVILGTNHFGRSRSVVGTCKDFETPFGTVPHDGDYMKRLDARLGSDLCENEYDHVREHSIELQVLLLKHLLGDRAFTIAPYLCPDPCGPTGTAPHDGEGVGLKKFATALRDELLSDDVPTCLVAAADLSHVGRFFQDDRDLDADNLHAVEALDRQALAQLELGDAEGFRMAVADRDNNTNICSVGCLYALATALDGAARPRLLHYHQAVTPEAENCVTCAAMECVKT